MNATTFDELALDRPADGLLGLAERGLLPDALLRAGIRHNCRERLRDESAGGWDAQEARLQRRLAQLRGSALAIETDAANRQHYELPPEFFALCLGARRKYSCCWYETGAETLDEAVGPEQRVLRELVAPLRLVEDVGGHGGHGMPCGWAPAVRTAGRG